MSPFSFSITSFTLTSFTVDSEEVPLPPAQRGQITSQGRSTVKPVAVLITIKVYLKYRVASLGTKTRIKFKVLPEQKPLIKFGSAILKLVARLFIPVKAASKPIPLSIHTHFYIDYKVDCLHTIAIANYKVDKLITQDQQLKAASLVKLASYYLLYDNDI
jgi:hypothetical protein